MNFLDPIVTVSIYTKNPFGEWVSPIDGNNAEYVELKRKRQIAESLGLHVGHGRDSSVGLTRRCKASEVMQIRPHEKRNRARGQHRQYVERGRVMKALSIKQPWLHFILNGWKTLEIRTWKTAYRGPLLLVASGTIDRKWGLTMTEEAFWNNKKRFTSADIVYGQALCIVDMVDCRPMVEADEEAAMCYWSPPIVKSVESPTDRIRIEQLYAWEFKNVRRIEPFPVKGRLSIYDVEMPKV